MEQKEKEGYKETELDERGEEKTIFHPIPEHLKG